MLNKDFETIDLSFETFFYDSNCSKFAFAAVHQFPGNFISAKKAKTHLWTDRKGRLWGRVKSRNMDSKNFDEEN